MNHLTQRVEPLRTHNLAATDLTTDPPQTLETTTFKLQAHHAVICKTGWEAIAMLSRGPHLGLSITQKQ